MNDSFIMMSQGNSSTRERLAANLRRHRVARHMSLSQLAHATSMSKATLSGIERGRANPTVDTLATLAEALGISISELLDSTRPGEVHIVRVRSAQARPWPADEPAERLLEQAGQGSGETLEIVEELLPAHHAQEREPAASGARDGVLVLQGKVIAGPVERISELSSGDYASFPSDVPHRYESTRATARILLLRWRPAPRR